NVVIADHAAHLVVSRRASLLQGRGETPLERCRPRWPGGTGTASALFQQPCVGHEPPDIAPFRGIDGSKVALMVFVYRRSARHPPVLEFGDTNVRSLRRPAEKQAWIARRKHAEELRSAALVLQRAGNELDEGGGLAGGRPLVPVAHAERESVVHIAGEN